MKKQAKLPIRKRSSIESAAKLLGGQVSEKTIRMPINNLLMGGDYTGTLYVGSQKKPVNVTLDTGSSTFAIDGNAYDPTKDKTAKVTDLVQEVQYGDGSNWLGGVVSADVTVGIGGQSATLAQVNLAVAYEESKSMFRNANGILGLAYTRLNDAFEMPGPTLPPKYHFNQIQAGHKTFIEPYFTQLESAGIVANKFAFYTLRSVVNLATTNPATDPSNNGFLILGGGEESTDLYTGAFQLARVVDDEFYNTNLKQVVVGNGKPISVSPPNKASGNASNSIVDSGTNGIYLDQTIFNAILSELSEENADALQAGYLPMSQIDLTAWPPITFVLEGALGPDVSLTVAPDTYWQLNSPKKGYALAVLYGDKGQGGGQSILGLPLMNNYFTIFDRSVNKGLGVISFATIKSPAGG